MSVRLAFRVTLSGDRAALLQQAADTIAHRCGEPVSAIMFRVVRLGLLAVARERAENEDELLYEEVRSILGGAL